MATSARKAKLRAEALSRTILRTERGVHRARGTTTSVTPAIVIWGAAQKDVPEAAEVDGVRFVRGRELLAWLEALGGEEVSKEAAADIVRRLKKFRKSSSQGTRASTTPPG